MENNNLKLKDDRHLVKSLDQLCEEALEKWGFDPQMDMVIEETSELTKAILKYRRKPSCDRATDIAKEIADVEIMLMQLKIAMFHRYENFYELIEMEKKFKASRLDNMLYFQP